MASLNVYELVHYLKLKLENDKQIHNCVVKGEISNFHRHNSGHWYFSLKDEKARIACVMFKSYALKLKDSFKDGDQVLVKATVSIFENSGSLQLYVSDMKLDGLGDLFMRFELLRQKLFKLGLFNEEHKKIKPAYPEKVAVVTGDKSAALSDIKTMFKKRWPFAKYEVYPCLVQGEGASQDIIKTLNKIDSIGYDAIVLARGGGSIEDLWAFNDEELAYTIYNLKTFLITGIGHEQDFTIADFVADLRAPTPTGAIEVLTPDIFDVKTRVSDLKMRLKKAIHLKIELNLLRYDKLLNRPLFLEKNYLINQKIQYLDYLISKLLHFRVKLLQNSEKIKYLRNNIRKASILQCDKLSLDLKNKKDGLYDLTIKKIKDEKIRLEHLIELLKAYDIDHILAKGFALVYRNDEIVKEDMLKAGEELKLRFRQSAWSIKTIAKEK